MATKLRAFKVAANKHHHDDGVTYKKGEIVWDERDLAAKFVNKFDEQHNVNPPAQAEEPVEANVQEEDEPVLPKKKAKAAIPPTDLGEDVTEAFAEAAKAGVKVFKVNGKYNVYEEDNLEEPVNKKPLSMETAVKKVSQYLDTEE